MCIGYPKVGKVCKINVHECNMHARVQQLTAIYVRLQDSRVYILHAQY